MQTSYGQTLCRRYIEAMIQTRFYENYRPSWLFGMELDFYFPDHNLAIEFNGDQHYFATGLSDDPSAQRRRDLRKRYLCRDRGVKLIVLKAIDLVMCKFNQKFKRLIPMNRSLKLKKLDSEAKQYRSTLKENFNSPTAHRGKGKARQKTVAKLFDQHPPSFNGKWNADKFHYQWNAWMKGKPKCLETVESFRQTHGDHLRARHNRELGKLAAKWETE